MGWWWGAGRSHIGGRDEESMRDKDLEILYINNFFKKFSCEEKEIVKMTLECK